MEIYEVCERYDLSELEKTELASYIFNRFGNCTEFNEPGTDFLKVWDGIIYYSAIFGAANAINAKLCPKYPVSFNSPDTVEISMYLSFAGKIPIIYVRDTADFEQVVTNISYKGERPDNISATGASFIHGKTVRFMILSAKPYSNVSACELGLDDEDDWAEKSLMLRRAHECTHFFTKQTYGVTNNILHDEIMADFTGIYETFGFFRAEWFLRFMGIIEGSGSRLIFYTKDLSPKVREAVTDIITQAAYRLEEWSGTESFTALSTAERIKVMCEKGLEGMIHTF